MSQTELEITEIVEAWETNGDAQLGELIVNLVAYCSEREKAAFQSGVTTGRGDVAQRYDEKLASVVQAAVEAERGDMNGPSRLGASP